MEPEPGILDFKVYDVATESWLIANLPCTCGGHWVSSGGQQLVDVDGRPCDQLDATCGACGSEMRFRFDVSAFFGHKEKTAAWIVSTLPDADERTRGRVARKLSPPLMTRVMSFIHGLAKDGDRVTLLYMQSRIAEAIASMNMAELDAEEREPDR